MARWTGLAALLLALGATAPAWAGDAEDCDKAVEAATKDASAGTDSPMFIAACARLANQGDKAAQRNLGFLYALDRRPVQWDNAGAARPLSNEAESVKWFRKAADQGDIQAQYQLAVAYANGRTAPQDYVEAAKWFRKAADQGYAAAQINLGVLYAQGRGVSQDYGEAARWYRMAADQGDEGAQCFLGNLYAAGQGVPQDNVQAYMWFSLAGGLGHRALDAVAPVMTRSQLEQAKELAAVWKLTTGQ